MRVQEAPDCWTEATLVTKLIGGRTEGRCGFIPAGTLCRKDALEAARCTAPTAYYVTSSAGAYPGRDVWEVCVDHAADARQMEWLGSISTSKPVRHRFSCRNGIAPCECRASGPHDQAGVLGEVVSTC